jgi:hypothetical protein
VTTKDLEIPTAIADAIRAHSWRDPGPTALRQILKGVGDLPDLMLFGSLELMRRVSGMLESGGYVDDSEFCMVRSAKDLSSETDQRLVFGRALFVAGSIVPGDDVFVAVGDSTAEGGRILVFDWNRSVPTRWVPIMTVEEFCAALAALNGGNADA